MALVSRGMLNPGSHATVPPNSTAPMCFWSIRNGPELAHFLHAPIEQVHADQCSIPTKHMEPMEEDGSSEEESESATDDLLKVPESSKHMLLPFILVVSLWRDANDCGSSLIICQ
jgi:hypothetical protein